ncbi:BTAD domain-containing putative transcriptional regulator [Orenia marismortui]|uniref:Transcriptional activator n=1 Tax=Orenia marismortui TaxID=46469 RepID=A0A4R8HAX7_9FIRM|nr:BTAD domain-containing putative transcriptional regulator [Orenia marismortui]TDX53205.1 transcriptional activator [Orenia marismortui]
MNNTNKYFIRPNYHFNKWYDKDLHNKYTKLKNYPLTIIKGGIGTGKSSSLSNFIANNFSEEFIWLNLSDDIELNTKLFWKLIIKATMFYNDNLEGDMEEIINDCEQGQLNIRDIINDLVEVIFNNFNNDLLLVIDNLEIIADNQEIINSLSYFINLMTSSFHLVLISREDLCFPQLDRWTVIGRAQFIKEDEFILDQGELKELLLLEYNLDFSKSELEQIYNKSEGWLLAVDIIAKAYDGDNIEGFLNDHNNFEVLDTYFSYQVLGKLDDKSLIEFLLKTSLLRELDIKVCNHFLKIDNSQEIINFINDKFGLVKKIDQESYRYYSLFRDFLKDKFKQFYSEFDYSDLIDTYLELGMIKEAIYYCCEANHKDKLFDIMEKSEEKLIYKEYRVLREVFTYLDEADFDDNPILYLYQGNLYLSQNDPYQSLASYQQAEDFFRRSGDRKHLKRALFKVAKVYAFFNSNKLLDYVEELMEFEDQLSDFEEEKLIYLRVISNIIRGDNKKATELIVKLEGSKYHNELLANLLFIKGKFRSAKEVLNQIDKPVEELCTYITLLIPIFLDMFLGNFYKVQEYILKQLEKDNYIIKLFSEYYLAQVSEFFYIEPREELKEFYLNKLSRIDSCPYQASWYRVELLKTIASWEVFYGSLEKVIEYSELGLEFAKRRRDKLYIGLFNQDMAMKYYYERDLERSLKLFKASIENFDVADNDFLVAHSLLLISVVYYAKGKNNNFIDYITKTLSIAKEEKYDFLFISSNYLLPKDPNKFIPLLLEARKQGVEVDYINRLLDQVDLSELDQAPGYSLKIKAFGRLKIYRGNQLIDESEWVRKKSKDLFKLFLVHRGDFLSKDQICQILYPDLSQEDAYRSFSVNLSCLNKVLNPNREAGDKPYFIIKDKDNYGLVNNFTYRSDVDIFGELIERGKQADSKLIKIKYYQQALDIYEGDFIVGDLYNQEIIKERKKLQQMYLEISYDLIAYYYENGDYNECIELADKALEFDKYYEAAYLYKMKSYNQLNRRSYAIKIYQRCKEILAEELNISPNIEIEEYYQEITL